MSARPDLEGYQASVDRCCGDKAGEQFCESFGCRTVVELLAYVAALEQDAAALKERLKAIEWDEETDNQQCAWCLAPKADGHDDGCKFAAILGAAS